MSRDAFGDALNNFPGTLAPAAIAAIPLRNSRLAQIDFIDDSSVALLRLIVPLC
jgi:hypothetical protein